MCIITQSHVILSSTCSTCHVLQHVPHWWHSQVACRWSALNAFSLSWLTTFTDYCGTFLWLVLCTVGWFKNQLQGRDQGTTQFCSIYQLYYLCKISATYSIWKWVLTDPKFCPLETQFKYIEQAHCSTESLVMSSSGWLAITMGWNLLCDRWLCCDVTSLVNGGEKQIRDDYQELTELIIILLGCLLPTIYCSALGPVLFQNQRDV